MPKCANTNSGTLHLSTSCGSNVGPGANLEDSTNDRVYIFVRQHCPELEPRVASWLICYRDPELLFVSLERIYGSPVTVVIGDW